MEFHKFIPTLSLDQTYMILRIIISCLINGYPKGVRIFDNIIMKVTLNTINMKTSEITIKLVYELYVREKI
jgi:hypothetical protein